MTSSTSSHVGASAACSPSIFMRVTNSGEQEFSDVIGDVIAGTLGGVLAETLGTLYFRLVTTSGVFLLKRVSGGLWDESVEPTEIFIFKEDCNVAIFSSLIADIVVCDIRI